MLVLAQLEYYVGFRACGVKTGIGGGIVVLELHHRVFAHCHSQVFVASFKSEGIDGCSFYSGALRRFLIEGVCVNRHKQIASRFVGDVATSLKGDETVGIAGIDHFKSLSCRKHFSELAGHA